MNTIGKRLNHLRKEILSLNQITFASILNVSQGALSDIENDNRGLPIEALTNLCNDTIEKTPFSILWLLTGKGQPLGIETQILSLDECEILETYRNMDARGKHTIHAAIYEELDRIQK